MDFVDDVDLIGAMRRRVMHAIDDLFAHASLHARTARRVELVDIGGEHPPRSLSTTSQVPSGSIVGAFSQSSAFAKIRAMVVLPVPRGPQKR